MAAIRLRIKFIPQEISANLQKLRLMRKVFGKR